MAGVEMAPIPDDMKGPLRFLAGLATGIGAGISASALVPQVRMPLVLNTTLMLTRRTGELNTVRSQIRRLLNSGQAVPEELTNAAEALAQQVVRLESRIQRLRSLDGNGGLNVAQAERAQQQALDALQRLENLASAPGLSPGARAQLRMGMAMRNARQALRNAEQNLANYYNQIDIAYASDLISKIRLQDRLRQGQAFTEQDILNALAQSQQTDASRRVLEAIQQGRIRIHLDPHSPTAGASGSPSQIILRPDMTMQDTLGVLVHEGQHALDMAAGIVPLPANATSVQRLLAEARSWSAELQFLRLNRFSQSASYELLNYNQTTLLISLGDSYLTAQVMNTIPDSALHSVLAEMF